MPVYAVSYDLRKHGQDYDGLYNALQSLNHWKYLDSTCLISTEMSAKQLWERLSPHIDRNDSILIIRVAAEHDGWLPTEAWDWIKDHVV